jgi:hypothetical protein
MFNIRFALPLPQHNRSPPITVTPTNGSGEDPPPTPLTIEQELASAVAASHTTTDGEDYIDARACLAQLQLQVDTIIQKTPTPCRLFLSTSVPGTFTALLSPKMARVLNCDSNPGTLPTYLGSLAFLDNQATSNKTFPTPIPLEEDGRQPFRPYLFYLHLIPHRALS